MNMCQLILIFTLAAAVEAHEEDDLWKESENDEPYAADVHEPESPEIAAYDIAFIVDESEELNFTSYLRMFEGLQSYVQKFLLVGNEASCDKCTRFAVMRCRDSKSSLLFKDTPNDKEDIVQKIRSPPPTRFTKGRQLQECIKQAALIFNETNGDRPPKSTTIGGKPFTIGENIVIYVTQCKTTVSKADKREIRKLAGIINSPHLPIVVCSKAWNGPNDIDIQSAKVYQWNNLDCFLWFLKFAPTKIAEKTHDCSFNEVYGECKLDVNMKCSKLRFANITKMKTKYGKKCPSNRTETCPCPPTTTSTPIDVAAPTTTSTTPMPIKTAPKSSPASESAQTNLTPTYGFPMATKARAATEIRTEDNSPAIIFGIIGGIAFLLILVIISIIVNAKMCRKDGKRSNKRKLQKEKELLNYESIINEPLKRLKLVKSRSKSKTKQSLFRKDERSSAKMSKTSKSTVSQRVTSKLSKSSKTAVSTPTKNGKMQTGYEIINSAKTLKTIKSSLPSTTTNNLSKTSKDVKSTKKGKVQNYYEIFATPNTASKHSTTTKHANSMKKEKVQHDYITIASPKSVTKLLKMAKYSDSKKNVKMSHDYKIFKTPSTLSKTTKNADSNDYEIL